MSLRIRLYEKMDFQRVLEICISAFTPIHEGFEDALGKTIFDYRYDKWQKDYAVYLEKIANSDPSGELYVVEDGGTVVGFIHAVLDKDRQIGEIGLNGVDPRHQGRGIGKKMYEFVLNELKGKGAKIAYVGTGADAAHAPARAAYAGVGFDKSIPSVHYFRTL